MTEQLQTHRDHRPKINRIFIANRGEIARRIALTAQKLGVETVCVTERLAPPGYLLGLVTTFIKVPEENSQLYLNQSSMIAFAKAEGCDAVHPGFGFLSENAEFAESVIAAGLTWIGPRPGSIDAMASKAMARIQAEKSGIPCLPGLNGFTLDHGDLRATQELEQFAERAGFPILMKASFGGGGKGMRIVHKKAELLEQAKRAASEALSSFGNGSLIVEKYLPSPRHVEVQIIADKHENVFIIGDRDCSLQRRHQKILEEAPAPAIPLGVRESMHKAARSLGLAVGYDNAGTVEFLLDESNQEDVKFYFLEMNTRLQVEHTVSEEVFGVDLVEWQIRVAQNEMLPADFANLRPQGHSIEVRIYAEDPGANFFPAPGPVRAFVPAQGRGIRWELGMDTVDKISTSFDPMISKLVCTASNRTQALTLLAQTLERTSFSGPRNNIPFLIWLARHKQVTQRPVDTHFIANHIQDALAWEIDERKRLEPLALELLSTSENPGFGAMHGNHDGQQESISAKCITAMAFSKGALPQDQRLKYVQLSTRSVAWSRTEYQASCQFGTGTYSNPYTHPPNNALVFSFARHQGSNAVEHWIGLSGHNWVNVESRATSDVGTKAQSQSDGMSAPVPGKVIGIQVTEGSLVEVGQTMFILESMKMQFEVKAGKRGTIGQIMVQVGVQVQSGEQLGAWQNA